MAGDGQPSVKQGKNVSTSTPNGLVGSPPSKPSTRGSDDGEGQLPVTRAWPKSIVLRFFLGTFAAQDLVLLGYLVLTRVLLARVAPSVVRDTCIHTTELCGLVMIAAAIFGRTIPSVPSIARKVVYRLSIVGAIVQNYLILRHLLPVLRPDSVDATLLRIDEFVFGREPALILEALNVRPVVEWFSFFYFSYFFIGATYMIVSVWLTKPGARTTAFGLGTVFVCCMGQVGYIAVPGYGPHQYLASQFHGPINGGFFWGCVWDAVQAGGAMKDIFPSLHTALPTWFALHAWNNAKDDPRWKWPAIITGFFATNIIFSTVFLRWHYVVDVAAGLTLACATGYFAPRIAKAEEVWRTKLGFRGAWKFD